MMGRDRDSNGSQSHHASTPSAPSADGGEYRVGSLLTQTKALIKKNLLVKWRMKKQFSFEIFFPVYMTIIVTLINLASQNTTYDAQFLRTAHPIIPQNASSPGTLAFVSEDASSYSSFITNTVNNVASLWDQPEAAVTFANESAFMDFYNHNSESFWAAVYLPDTLPTTGFLNYTIRIQYDTSGSTSDFLVPSTNSNSTVSITQCRNHTDCDADDYVSSGFLALQAALDHAWFTANDGAANETFLPPLTVSPMPVNEVKTDSNAGINTAAMILLIMAFSPTIQYLMTNVVAEKEKGIKEAMYLMGMHRGAYWLSWLATYALTLLIPSVIMTAISCLFGVFKHSNFLVVFLVLYIFSCSLVSLAFLFTPFFTDAKVAGIAGSLATTIMSLLTFAMNNGNISVAAKFGASLVSPCAVSLALGEVLNGNDNGGYNLSDMAHARDGGAFSVAVSLGMMLADVVLYLVVAWYLDSVVPGNGVTRPLLYPLHALLALVGVKPSPASHVRGSALIEEGRREDESELTRQQQPVIAIENVGMRYNKKDNPALTNVSLKMYDGQIFGLLGHNGAGKTTLHSIITGMKTPTAGHVFVNGEDLAVDSTREKMRVVMGVCPQKDILFDVLTVYEHIQLYGSLKGVRDDVKALTLLREIDLDYKKDEFSRGLSGGQKRKLSVGIALIGDPKILCLDEPSSGMDPYSRRKLWELLQNKRRGRVTLLTTHYMQEADILADRKAILSRGRIQCVGSSLFLKSAFGVGYHLNVAKLQGAVSGSDAHGESTASLSASFSTERLHKMIQSHIDGAKVEEGESNSEVSFSLPTSSLPAFPTLLQKLADAKAEFGVKAFGVSMTTLEEVFIRLHEQEEAQELLNHDAKVGALPTTGGDGSSARLPGNDGGEDEEDEGEDGSADTTPLLGAASANRNRRSINSTSDVPQAVYGSGSMGRASRQQPGSAVYGGVNGEVLPKAPDHASVLVRMKGLMVIRFKQTIRNPPAVFFQIVFPAVLMIISMTVVAKPSASNSPNQPLDVMAFTSDVYPSAFSTLPINDLSAALINGLNKTLPSTTHIYGLSNGTMQGKDGFLTREIGKDTFASAFEQLSSSDPLNIFFNGSFVHSLPIALSFLSNAALSSVGAATSASSQPLHGKEEFTYDATLFYTVLLIGIGLSAVPGGFAIDVVKDRASKMKHQLRVSGVSPTMYWLSYLLMNVGIFSWSTLFTIILSQAVGIKPLSGPALPMLILLCVVYMPFTVLFAFNCSFIFNEPETVQSVFPPLNNFIGFIPYIIVAVIDGLGRQAVAKALHFTFSVLIPPYTILGALYYLFRITLETQFNPLKDTVTVEDIWDPANNVSPTLIVMVGGFLVQFGLLTLIENWPQVKARIFGGPKVDTLTYVDTDNTALDSVGLLEDEDVVAERDEILHGAYGQQGSKANSDLVVRRLRKTFISNGRDTKRFTAVRDSTFCVDEGDLLGLLGPNGAGKTTTISVITGEEVPTAGEVLVRGRSLLKDRNRAMALMGYCPQFTALWERITTKEHLIFFASIKGHTSRAAEQLAAHHLRLFGIEEHTSKPSKALSGGTQRKLNVAISMLNEPAVCLLDEPSTGMDPNSKRTLWNVIKKNTKAMAGILTTHSMEEAEALCNKIAIMVKGRIVCVGSPTHLKNKYGTGYSLEVKTRDSAKIPAIQALLDKHFSGVVLEEQFDGHVTFRLEEVQDKDLGTVFGLMEAEKRELLVSEYALSQSTLEQVFLRFARLQDVNIDALPEEALTTVASA